MKVGRELRGVLFGFGKWEGWLVCSASIRGEAKPAGTPAAALQTKRWPGSKKTGYAAQRIGATELAHGCGTGHDQEIRQPTALQHRYEHLCHARRPRGHGKGGGGFHRP